MTKIKKITFREIARPLRTTFSTALGKKNLAKSVLVEAVLSDGSSGTGECPTSFAIKHETTENIKNTLAAAGLQLLGKPVDEYETMIGRLRNVYERFPMTISGLETALFRAYLSSQSRQEYSYWGSKKNRLATDITIPFIPSFPILKKWLGYVLKKRFSIYKLKVSGNVEEDKKFITAVNNIIRDNKEKYMLRLDGNQGFTEKTFVQFTDFIIKKDIAIQVFEQPLKKDDYAGLREIKKYSPAPVILDETIFTPEDARRSIDNNLCDGINIKLAKSGLSESMKIMKIAKKHKLKLMIGCMTETMTGLSASIYMAAGTDAFDYIDLDSVYFFYHSNVYKNIKIGGNGYTISRT